MVYTSRLIEDAFDEYYKEYKCPMYNKGICEAGILPMCKFSDKKCFVNALVYSLFLRKKRGGYKIE